MNNKSYFLKAFDDRQMFFNQWTTTQSPIATLIVIHGMGEHSGRYAEFAEYFNQKGIDVFAVDLFGHGKTEGPKGHTPHMGDYLWQITFLIKMVIQLGRPIFLYGHSMGGGLVLNYLFRKHPEIDGVIVSAPAIQPAFSIPKPKLMFGKLGRKLFPAVTQRNGLNVEGLSKDEEVINAYQADPLVHDIISAEVGIGVIEWGNWLLNSAIEESHIPLLLMHGNKDKLTSYEATEAFYQKFKKGDVSFKAWPNLYHELHNEPEKQEVLDFVYQWIKERS